MEDRKEKKLIEKIYGILISNEFNLEKLKFQLKTDNFSWKISISIL